MPSNLPTSQLAYPTHIIPLPLPCPSQTVNAENACPAKNRATAAMTPRSKHREPVSNMLRVFHSTRRPQGTGKNPPPQNNLLHSTNTARRHHQRGQGKTSSAPAAEGSRIRNAVRHESGTHQQTAPQQQKEALEWSHPPACMEGRRRKANSILCRLSGKKLVPIRTDREHQPGHGPLPGIHKRSGQRAIGQSGPTPQ